MTEKTSRGFLLWESITNDCMVTMEFQESSAMGLNTWIRIREPKDLNQGALTHAGKYPVIDLEFKETASIHMGIQDLIKLREKIDEIIKYQLDTVDGRASWYT